MDRNTALRERLRSCIAAVLDLEEDFRAQGMDRALGEEMDEEVLARLEKLTAKILNECVLEGRVSANRDKVLQ